MAFPGPSRYCGVKMTILGALSLSLGQGGIFRAVSLFSREVYIFRAVLVAFSVQATLFGHFLPCWLAMPFFALVSLFFVKRIVFGLPRRFFQQAARGWFSLRAKCGFGGTFQFLGARLKIDGH